MKFRFALLALLCPFLLFSQENISGIINDYAAVNDLDTCTLVLTVDDATGFQEDMSVLLIQMQGAQLNSGNNADFGQILDIGSAGFYERNEILAINGNEITLRNALLHPYNVDGSVQLVSIPVYQDAFVDNLLTALPWDGQKGGILIFEVENQLILDGPIDVSGLGFRGGLSEISVGNNCSFATNANNYSYDPTDNWRGAFKGEGIGRLPAAQAGGRGPQANGGGGGNDHNSGGGGGSQIGTGGQGGENREPSFFGCDGQYPGLGGRTLETTEDRLFLGGGGGAGHENNDVGTDGGDGGGIVIIIAGELEALGFPILANGADGANTQGDGAGGGGGGGTILLLTETAAGYHLEANGGNGGNINNGGEDRCIGPGGGGGGGRILSNLPFNAAFFQTNPGTAGMSVNSSDGNCPDGTNGAQGGEIGSFETLDTLLAGMPSSTPEIITQPPATITACEGDSITIKVVLEGTNLDLQWQVFFNGEFAPLVLAPPYSGTTSSTLVINPVNIGFDNNIYRLQIGGGCGEEPEYIYADETFLQIIPGPEPNFTFVVDGLDVQFTNTSQNGNNYAWNFGDSQQSFQENPTHTFAESGTYEVSLTTTNACGSETITIPVTVSNAMPPVAAFTAEPTSGCIPFEVQYTNQSTGEATGFIWLFPGGTPAFSNEENPLVTYNAAGSYSATMVASNPAGVDTLVLEDIIEANQPPAGNFTNTVDELEVTFLPTVVGADSYLWQFGDSEQSTDESPIHTYVSPGTYMVTLVVTNECGSTTIEQSIQVGLMPSAAFTASPEGGCAPRVITFTNTSTGLFDSQEWTFPGGNPGYFNRFGGTGHLHQSWIIRCHDSDFRLIGHQLLHTRGSH